MQNRKGKPVQVLDRNERVSLKVAIEVMSEPFPSLPHPLQATLQALMQWRFELSYPPDETMNFLLGNLSILEQIQPTLGNRQVEFIRWLKLFIIRYMELLIQNKEYYLQLDQ